MEFTQNRKCIFGYSTFEQLGSAAKGIGKRALIACYPSVKTLVEKACGVLETIGVETHVYDQILPEPTLECIEGGHSAAEEFQCDMVIGIGGGSVLDSAKAIAMLMKNPESLESYQLGNAEILNDPLPLIAVPTTAGTGSEATKTCVISNLGLGVKKSINHYKLVPEVVILDGELLKTLPPHVLASTGMDALGHAIESYTSLAATPYSRMVSGKAVELLTKNLKKAFCGEGNEAYQNVMLGSYLAGCGINNAGIGIAHIVGQPLGALTHRSHGELIAVLLPYAMEYNFDYCKDMYAQIGRIINPELTVKNDEEAAVFALESIREIRKELGIPEKLSGLNFPPLPEERVVLENIMRTTGHIRINPRPVDEKAFWQFICRAL